MKIAQAINSTDLEAALKVCASEPIHELGMVQPHGMALVFSSDPPFTILQASDPSRFLACDHSAIIGRPLAHIFSVRAITEIFRLRDEAIKSDTANGRLTAAEHDTPCDLLVHIYISSNFLVMELEKDEGEFQEERLAELLLTLERSIIKSGALLDMTAYLDLVARLVRDLTDYDSVMVYRFDADWNGEVIAQHRADYAPSYLGMHFPASDIPEQARRLYTLNVVRIIKDIDARPVPIVPELNPLTGRPLDMSFSALRSLSPIHIEYLRNIGVQASMTISLLNNGKLWGLIACHHMAAKRISLALRNAAVFVSKMVAARWESFESTERSRLLNKTIDISHQLLKAIPTDRIDLILDNLLIQLGQLLKATGVVAIIDGKRFVSGLVPSEPELEPLLQWLGGHKSTQVFQTNHLKHEFPPAEQYPELAAGLLSTPPSEGMYNCIIWLRPEKVRTVKWAGRYEEGFIQNSAGNYRLTPRKSFELWTEAWVGRSEPWSDQEVSLAEMLALSLPETLRKKSKLENTQYLEQQTTHELIQHRNHLEQIVSAKVSALAIAREAADEANRTAMVKSQFLANMSHEIRTPINAVLGFSRIGMRDCQEEAMRATFERIHVAGSHLLGVINDVLDFSKIEAGKLSLDVRPFQLDHLLDSACNLMLPIASQKELGFPIEKSGPLPSWMLGDEQRVLQILVNLLSNAFKFTSNGSVSLRLAGDGDILQFQIVDTGIGMSGEEISRLFRPFEQADASSTRRFGGTGLGLVISKTLAEQMGGRIDVTSQLGIGSVFTLRLPLPATEAPSPLSGDGACTPGSEAGNPLLSEKPLAGLHILAAEDEHFNRLILEDMLLKAGARCTLVENGAEAVAKVIRHPDVYDLVLMDVQMPVMDGHQATRDILQLAPTLPVIGLTAHALREERERCFAAGMVEHLTKPIDPATLIVAVQKLGLSGVVTETVSVLPEPTHAQIATDGTAEGAGEIDFAALDARFVHQPEFVGELLKALIKGHASTPALLRQHVEDDALEELRKLAHRIKGLAANLSSANIQHLAGLTEQSLLHADNRAPELAKQLADRIESMIDQARQRLTGLP